MQDINRISEDKVVLDRGVARTNLDRLQWKLSLLTFLFITVRGLLLFDNLPRLLLFVVYFAPPVAIIEFLVFYSGLLRKLKISQINLIWCFLFAPFGWIYLYVLASKKLNKFIKDEAK